MLRLDARIVGESALERDACRSAQNVPVRALAEHLRCFRVAAAARVALFTGEDDRAQPRSLNAPVPLPAEDVERVARGESGQSRETPIDQSTQRLDSLGGARNLRESPWNIGERIPNPLLQSVETRRRRAARIAQSVLRRE